MGTYVRQYVGPGVKEMKYIARYAEVFDAVAEFPMCSNKGKPLHSQIQGHLVPVSQLASCMSIDQLLIFSAFPVNITITNVRPSELVLLYGTGTVVSMRVSLLNIVVVSRYHSQLLILAHCMDTFYYKLYYYYYYQ